MVRKLYIVGKRLRISILFFISSLLAFVSKSLIYDFEFLIILKQTDTAILFYC